MKKFNRTDICELLKSLESAKPAVDEYVLSIRCAEGYRLRALALYVN